MSKILIVDDEVQIRTLLARMMELEGYEVCQLVIAGPPYDNWNSNPPT